MIVVSTWELSPAVVPSVLGCFMKMGAFLGVSSEQAQAMEHPNAVCLKPFRLH
jgi:hypothetical protein